ncbi:hypothetical protein ACX80E_09975 [Arthrobacter sp. TMN-49]
MDREGMLKQPEPYVGQAQPPEVMPRRGLTLLHTTCSAVAGLGQLVTFTSYVINEGSEPLEHVRLVLMSLSNANMAHLRYSSSPAIEELKVGALAPAGYAKWQSQYTVTQLDVAGGGPVVSAMAVMAVAQDGTELRDEGDVVLEVAWGVDAD